MGDARKYNLFEPTLQIINAKYISLPDDQVARNNQILKEVVLKFIDKMKANDELFVTLYRRIFSGGSFFDGLKVGHPNEYDLDILLQLPKCPSCWFYCNCLTLDTSNKPGYVWVKIAEERYKNTPLKKLINSDNYLDTSKVRMWMHSLIQRTMNSFNGTYIDTQEGRFKISYWHSGPAYTLSLVGEYTDLEMDVDLVPCFVFDEGMWPKNGFRKNPVAHKKEFFIVPKPVNIPSGSRYWRLSFQEQERELIKNLEKLKPALRLLKKMRDSQRHDLVSSYFIKTIFLWEVLERPRDFWSSNSLSYIFMTMLKRYRDHLQKGKILYYWQKTNNLVENFHKDTLVNFSRRLDVIIKTIENNTEDPFIVAKYILLPDEYETLIVRDSQAIKEENEKGWCNLM